MLRSKLTVDLNGEGVNKDDGGRISVTAALVNEQVISPFSKVADIALIPECLSFKDGLLSWPTVGGGRRN